MLKVDCTIQEEKYMPDRSKSDRRSTEFMFIGVSFIGSRSDGQPEAFVRRGDSDSVVWGEDGGVVGLLFTGQQPHGCRTGYSLVTPIEDVFQSIKEMSNG